MNYTFPDAEEFPERQCFKCNKTLNFGEFSIRNQKSGLERLKKLWNNSNVKFYCCFCFDWKREKDKLSNINKKLDFAQKDALKILERTSKKKIPLVSEIKDHTIGYTVEGDQIVGLSLFQCNFHQVPDCIFSFSSLRVLNLSWNKISLLPEAIEELNSLISLDLMGNHIQNIPSIILNLKKLKYLDLGFNSFKKFPYDILNSKSIKRVNIVKNNIGERTKLKKKVQKNNNCEIIL